LADARRDAARTLADADRLRAAQQNLLCETQNKERQAVEAADAARRAAAKADEAQRNADAREKDFANRIDRLKVALSEAK
jgi:hypothetical protein